MKRNLMVVLVLAVMALLIGGIVIAGSPAGTGFTYQGFLKSGGSPANGAYDFEFRLYDAETNGAQVGSLVAQNDVTVSYGLFVATLDFGADAFNGDARWLDISVRPGEEMGAYTALTPRQALTPAPYALHAGAALTATNATTATYATNAGNADRLAGQDSTAFQARVSGECALGSTVRLINADGSVVCEPRATRPGFSLATLDSAGNVGNDTAVTIGTDGLGLISYSDLTNSDLKVAHCNDAACTTATTTTLDSAVNVGWFTSVTIGADGLGLISYRDITNAALKVAHCSNTACTAATLTTLDATGGLFGVFYTSVAIGADGLGLISYSDFTNRDLKVAHCNDPACTTATHTTLDSTGNVGEYSSVTIGADGLGLISYRDSTNYDLKVAHCSNTNCTTATFTTLDSDGNVGLFTSVTIGADGLGLISYGDDTNKSLKAAHCSNLICTAATLATLDSLGGSSGALYTSVTIGADGLGLIS